jgi:hypothetical protein
MGISEITKSHNKVTSETEAFAFSGVSFLRLESG